MKKICRLIICMLICAVIIVSGAVMSYAASLGKVGKLAVSKVSSTSVSLQWKKVPDAAGYSVYRYNSSKDKYIHIGNTKKLKYTDESLEAGKTYTYKVRAYTSKKSKKTYGAYSSSVKALTKPAKVKKLKAASVTSSSVKLTWAKSKGAKRYEVYIYDETQKKYITEATTKSTSYTVKYLRPATEYKFRVIAYNTVNDKKQYGKKSSTLTALTNLATVSDITVTDVTPSSYVLNWKKVPGATSYRISKYDSDREKWVSFATTKKTKYTVKGLSYGSSAKYQIKAMSDIADGEYSKTVTAMTIARAPRNLKATTDTESVFLTWSRKGKSTGYEIERYSVADSDWEVIGTSKKTSFTDSGLSKVDTYIYRVRGYFESGKNRYYTEYSDSVDIYFESSVESGNIYNDDLTANGVAGYLYDPVENCFYTSDDPWHRNFGYNEVYDSLAPITMISFDTVRLKFDYDEKNWMIQLWKGQYGAAFYGAEIGVYNKPADRAIEHYDCVSDDERLKMSMDFYEYKSSLFGEDGWEKQFSRPYDTYWWCTGFIPGNKAGNFGSLRVDARITAKDYDMLKGIKKALEENSIMYTTSGLNIYFTYN